MPVHDIIHPLAIIALISGVSCLAGGLTLAMGDATARVPAAEAVFMRHIYLALGGVVLLLLALVGAFILHS